MASSMATPMGSTGRASSMATEAAGVDDGGRSASVIEGDAGAAAAVEGEREARRRRM